MLKLLKSLSNGYNTRLFFNIGVVEKLLKLLKTVFNVETVELLKILLKLLKIKIVAFIKI